MIVDFNAAKAATKLFNFKPKITGQTAENGTKMLMVQLKCLTTFWRTLKKPLTNCEINLDLDCSTKGIIVATAIADKSATFSITDTKLYVPVVTLLTQNNAKLLQNNANLVLKEQLTGIDIN